MLTRYVLSSTEFRIQLCISAACTVTAVIVVPLKPILRELVAVFFAAVSSAPPSQDQNKHVPRQRRTCTRASLAGIYINIPLLRGSNNDRLNAEHFDAPTKMPILELLVKNLETNARTTVKVT